MNTRQVTHQYRLSHWSPIIRDCKNSGMTVKDWCIKNDVNEKRYYYWQRRIREELSHSLPEKVLDAQPPRFVPITTKSNTDHITSSFKPDLVLNYGTIKLEIANSISPELLNEMLKVLSHV